MIYTILKKELRLFFASSVSYVFIGIFGILLFSLTFFTGRFFEGGQADLIIYFSFHPWIYAVFIPALTMRLWSEEHKSGTIEIIMTQPVGIFQWIIGKFLAGWVLCILSLIATIPLWVTVNILGTPDNGIIIGSYFASILVAGAFVAIGCAFSACTKNQVVAFVISIFVCIIFLLSNMTVIRELFASVFGDLAARIVAGFSVLNHYDMMIRGHFNLINAGFFISLMVLFLNINSYILAGKRK